MDKHKFYIGEGPVALEIIAEVKAKYSAQKEARAPLEEHLKTTPFEGMWEDRSFMSKSTVGGVCARERLLETEERDLGVKFFSVLHDGSGYAYKPRLNTKVGKKLKAMIDEANKSAFSHSAHITRRTGMERMVFGSRNLRYSVGCCTDDRIFVKVPVPMGNAPDESADKSPVPPVWFREVLESEWLAGLGR